MDWLCTFQGISQAFNVFVIAVAALLAALLTTGGFMRRLGSDSWLNRLMAMRQTLDVYLSRIAAPYAASQQATF